jgi:hypothetical protein
MGLQQAGRSSTAHSSGKRSSKATQELVAALALLFWSCNGWLMAQHVS